jgi:hypothetical protein
MSYTGRSSDQPTAISARLAKPVLSSGGDDVISDAVSHRDGEGASSCDVLAPIEETTVTTNKGTKQQRQGGAMADPGRPARTGHGLHLKGTSGRNGLPIGHTPAAPNSQRPMTILLTSECV